MQLLDNYYHFSLAISYKLELRLVNAFKLSARKKFEHSCMITVAYLMSV